MTKGEDKISKSEVEHVAELARLGLSEDEIKKFQKELSSILDYVNKLREVDTEGVEPTFQTPGLKNVFRQDVVDKSQSLSQEEALKNAPDKKEDYFKVKPVKAVKIVRTVKAGKTVKPVKSNDCLY